MPRSEDEGRRLPLRIKRKTYYGKGAKDKAARQGRAIRRDAARAGRLRGTAPLDSSRKRPSQEGGERNDPVPGAP
jgi:hypothetical protein